MLSSEGLLTERCPGERPGSPFARHRSYCTPAAAVAQSTLHRRLMRIRCPALPFPTSAMRQPIELYQLPGQMREEGQPAA